jgi:branched-chain amino acid transport system permease protein
VKLGNTFHGSSIARQLAIAIPVVIVLLVIPTIADVYQTQLLTYGLIFAIAALGFNLLLGYTGLLSFGHSAYFGVGAYAVAFMVKYLGVSSMELYILGGVFVTAVVTALFGLVCVRYTRIFFAILTLALSQVLWTLAFKFFWITGGTDGLRVPFSKMTLLGGLIDFTGSGTYIKFIHSYYYYVLVVFCICVVVMWLIVHSPFGKTLQAIRDNETRARFLGVRIRQYRWLAFLISGIFTGLAGILWVPLNGLTTPDILYWPQSGKIVFFTVLGGFRNFTGPIVGAVAFNYLEAYAVAVTQYWQITLGAVLIGLVLFLPGGIVGTLSRVVTKFTAKEKAKQEALP